jgi:hypothetical protein
VKVKVLLLVVSLASFLAALVCAQGIITGKHSPPGWF